MAAPINNISPTIGAGSALLGTGKSVTVLDLEQGQAGAALFGNLGSANDVLFQRIKTNANQRLVQAQKQINDIAKQRLDAINVLNERWISVKAQINLAQAYVSTGQDTVKKISDTVLQLRISAASAGEPNANVKKWREDYDMQVNKLNIFADSGTSASNLVGSINRIDYAPNKVEYRNDLGAGVTFLRGTYAGSDFRIEANDGTVWVPDLGSDILQAYSGLQGAALKYTTTDGQTVGRATSTRNGLKLVDYNPQSKQITLHVTIVSTDPPVVVSGTLKTAGIGVMQSWFYNGLETAEDRKRALRDLSAAEINLTSVNADLQRSKTQIDLDQRRVMRAFEDLTRQSVKARDDQQTRLDEVKVKTAQQYIAMQANLKNLQTVQANYVNVFGSLIRDPFAQALLNITA
jgi:hypothetical protein